jgi:lipoic acid synthetase
MSEVGAGPSEAPQGVKRRHPAWLKVRAPGGPAYESLLRLVREQRLHTVCESAACPNIGECWSSRELTLMILGNVCTRSCGFCDVATGRPGAVDPGEPARVAYVLSRLELKHAVITSVDRDDLKDGGSTAWAETLKVVRAACPAMTVEALIPDFKARAVDLDRVFDARPHILAHNLETVPRLNRVVRPQAAYARSLAVISRAKARGLVTKSGLMLGLGERMEEVRAVMQELVDAGCDILTMGQYLRPSPAHLPVERYVEPSEFDALRDYGRSLGYRHVESGPLVRSSYHAGRQAHHEFDV